MLVKELIEQLLKFNPDNLVYCICSGDSPFDCGNITNSAYEINSSIDDENSVYISHN